MSATLRGFEETDQGTDCLSDSGLASDMEFVKLLVTLVS